MLSPDLLRVPVGYGAMHVERFGHAARPIVLLHGFGTCTFLWREVAPALALQQHLVCAIDLFGHGQSDRPIEADFGIAGQAEHLDRALTALRIPRATIVGVDLGAAVALRLAATRAERVERLILINPLWYDAVPGRDVVTLQRNTARFAFRVSAGLLGASPLLTPLLKGSVSHPERMSDRLLARYLAPFVGKDGVAHLLALGRAVRHEDVDEIAAASVVAPTLVVRGEDDRYVDDGIADRLATELPAGKLVRLPGVGRLVPEEAPEVVAELVHWFATDPDPSSIPTVVTASVS